MTNLFATLILLGFVVTAVVTTPSLDVKLKNIDQRFTLLEKLAPTYVWGGFWGLLGGDCSGQTYAGFTPDFPGKRTTAFRMWLGYGNWGKNNIEGPEKGFEAGDFPKIVFFNYGGKIASHVGTWRKKSVEEEAYSKKIKKETKVFAEASSSARYFKRTTIIKGDTRYKAILGTKTLAL
jgi:hypothetical protein